MAVSLDTCLENAIGIVDPAGISLQAKQQLSRGSGAVDTGLRVST
jgi:hypothetical protein